MLYSRRSVGFTFVVITMGVVGSALFDPVRSGWLGNLVYSDCTLLAPIQYELLPAQLRPDDVDEPAPIVDAHDPIPQFLGVVEYGPLPPATNLDDRPEIKSLLEGDKAGR